MNTWCATLLDSKVELESFRSGDFDPVGLLDEHGPVAVYDKTDGMRLLYTVSDSGRVNEAGYVIVRVDDDPTAEGGLLSLMPASWDVWGEHEPPDTF